MGYQKFKKHIHTFLWDIGGTGDSSTATGVIPIFSAPANCLVHAVAAEVLTLVAGSSAEELGDGTDVDGYLVDGFAAATGYFPLHVQESAATFSGVFQFDSDAGVTDAADVTKSPKKILYGSADTIDYKISGTATAGKIRFFVEFSIVA